MKKIQFEKGDMLLFLSHKYHTVAEVTSGLRQVLILELWQGEERECAHRCEQHWGACTTTLAVARMQFLLLMDVDPAIDIY